MPRYRVPFTQCAIYRVVWEVEADTAEEAEDKVLDGFGSEVSADRLEFLDDMEVLTDEITKVD